MKFFLVQEHEKNKKISQFLKKQKIYDSLAVFFALIGYIWEYSQVIIF